MAGILVDDLDRIICADGLISQVWAGPTLVYQYDNVKPVLAITAPTGMSAAAPTYVQSDTAVSYTVTGTVTDAESGVKSVTVNDVPAEVADDGSWSATLTDLATNTTHQITVVAEDNAGNVNTVNRYLCIEPRASATYTSLWKEIQQESSNAALNMPLTNWGSKELAGPLQDSSGSIEVLRSCTLSISLTANLQVSGTNGSREYYLRILQNGSVVAQTKQVMSNGYNTPVTVTYNGPFAAGDIISCDVNTYWTDANSTLKVHNTNTWTVTQVNA